MTIVLNVLEPSTESEHVSKQLQMTLKAFAIGASPSAGVMDPGG